MIQNQPDILLYVNELYRLALSTPDGVDMFVNYSGHTTGLAVSINYQCVYQKRVPEDVVFNECVYLDDEDSVSKLVSLTENCKAKLEELANKEAA